MMNGEFHGIIGAKGYRPTKTYQMKQRNGETKKTPFMRFTMFCEDTTQRMVADENGVMRRPKKQVQVILPENERGEKLFEYLEPGRRVYVKGRVTNNPVVSNGNLYVNEKCYMGDLTFMDSPRDKQIERALRDMTEAKAISEDEAASFLILMKEFYAGRTAERDAPRIVIDDTKPKPTETTSDPDQLDF